MTTKRKKSSASKRLEKTYGPISLNQLVESIRLGEEWSKREMAEKLGVSPTFYSDFIAGNKPVSPQKAQQWAQDLGYDPLQFVELALQDQLERFALPYQVQLIG